MMTGNKIFMVGMAVTFIAVGGYWMFQTLDFLKGAEQVEGVIAQMDIRYGRGTSRATIVFDAAGQPKSAVVPINFRLHRKGDRIPVYYNSAKTPAVKLNNFTSVWLFPLGFLAAGLVCLILVLKK